MLQSGQPEHHEFDNWQHPQKSNFYINERNELVYKNSSLNKEYKIGVFKGDEMEQIVNSCIDNYNLIIESYNSIHEKWVTADNKLSLKNDIFQLRNTINKLPAIGSWDAVLIFLKDAEQVIHDIYDENKKIKEAIVSKAEKVLEYTDWKSATDLFKELQEEWKNAPETSKNDHDILSARFNEYKNAFFNKRNEALETQHMLNWDKKIELCEKAESVQSSMEWRETSDILQELFEEWKKTGNVTSHEKNEELWNRFNTARQHFYDRKNAHSDQIKIEQNDNLSKKTAIVEEAESLANSIQWKETQNKLEQLQTQWDAIGRVPQEFSDDLWNRWRKAKDTFYEAKKNFNKEYLKSLNDNYERKNALTEKAEELSMSNKWRSVTDELAQLLEEWKTIGPIPREYGDDLWNRFNEARRLFFQRKDEDREVRRKHFAEKAQSRISQTERFLSVLSKELDTDNEQLTEFKNNLEDIDGTSKKDSELKDHLKYLIAQLEKQIAKRMKKIDDVERQLAELRNTGE